MAARASTAWTSSGRFWGSEGPAAILSVMRPQDKRRTRLCRVLLFASPAAPPPAPSGATHLHPVGEQAICVPWPPCGVVPTWPPSSESAATSELLFKFHIDSVIPRFLLRNMRRRLFHNKPQALIQRNRFYIPRVGIHPNGFGSMGESFLDGMLQARCPDSSPPREGEQLDIKRRAAIMVRINGIKGLSAVNAIVRICW